jgi:EAL domain-containing protein (putative c-di-GMP-specific phosphodiesterase class I)
VNFEITENASSLDRVSTNIVLQELRALGISISVDDFGTGFSSLAQLRDLNVDEIKIDLSFVSNMLADARDCLIVRSILQLGASLELGTVAEGVEDPLVVELLRDLGCDRAQGFYFGAPGSPEAIVRRVRRMTELDPSTSAGLSRPAHRL